jgi:hypothetical protein
VGAIVGALAGTIAAIGVDHPLREEVHVRMNRVDTGVTGAMTQRVLTAAEVAARGAAS